MTKRHTNFIINHDKDPSIDAIAHVRQEKLEVDKAEFYAKGGKIQVMPNSTPPEQIKTLKEHNAATGKEWSRQQKELAKRKKIEL